MPYHIHESNNSTYLGSEEKNNTKYDYYYASQINSATVIARFGEDGDYISGLLYIKSLLDSDKDILFQLNTLKASDEEDISVLATATLLSIDKGLLDINLRPKQSVKRKIK